MASAKHVVNDESENVKVAVRVRPLNKKELKEGIQNITSIDKSKNVISLIRPGSAEEALKSFKFDHVFPEDSSQVDLYMHIADPLVEKVLHGYNSTIFVYGQTGTGKTYTMVGKENCSEQKGLMPNTFHHIFKKISNCDINKSAVVTVSYLEIYNEDIRDLLSCNPNAKLEVRERPDFGVYVKNLSAFTVDSIEGITDLMNKGNANRFTRSTLMNDISSRSHAIFTMTIERRDKSENKITIGKLNLVDLAGSERLSRTRATGACLKEASNINQSLSTLGIVISALIDNKCIHIPYRNSKLTRLLQDSLGGNSQTAMIAMISPSENDYDESLCTLRYASRVKYIKNQTRANVKTKKNTIALLKQKIVELSVSLITLRKEKDALVLGRKQDKERFQEFCGGFQNIDNIEEIDLFDDRKSIEDYTSEDDDIDDCDLNSANGVPSEMDPATKTIWNLLVRQAPANTMSSILKVFALGELHTYTKDNFKQYSQDQENQAVLFKSKKNHSTPNLASDTKIFVMRRCKSLTSIDSVNSNENFNEINCIRAGLEKLQSVLTPKDQKKDASASSEDKDNFNTLTMPVTRENEELVQLKNDCEGCVTKMRELEDKLDALSRENADLDRTNAFLQMQIRQATNNYMNLQDYRNAALQRVDDLIIEREKLANDNRKSNDELTHYKNTLDHHLYLLEEQRNAEADLKCKNKNANEKIIQLTRDLSIANENLTKHECEASLSKHRECALHETIKNKEHTIARLEADNKIKTSEVLAITDEKKRIEDRLTLLNVKLKHVEENLDDNKNQNSILRKANIELKKAGEDQREEILELKSSTEENLSLIRENQKLLITIKNKTNEVLTVTDEKKRIEDRLTLLNVKLKHVEESLDDNKNQNSILHKANIELKKAGEDQREEILKLKSSKEEKLSSLIRENQKLLITIKNKTNEVLTVTEEKKRIEDRLTLLNVKLKHVEGNLDDNKNQNSNLQKANIELKKAVEDQREEILKLKSSKEEKLSSLIRENQKLLIDLHKEITLKSDIDLKLKEDKMNELVARRESQDKIALLEKENLKLQIIINDLKKKNFHDLTEQKGTIANLMKAEEAVKTKDKEIYSLKTDLSETQTKLQNTIRNLEDARSNCECKKSPWKSLYNRRRLEKNILQDTRRNITEEDDTESGKSQPFESLNIKSDRIQNESEKILENGNREESRVSEIIHLKIASKKQQGKIADLEEQIKSKEFSAKELLYKYEQLKCITRRRHAKIIELEKQLKIMPTTAP